MNPNFKNTIENEYNLTIKKCIPAPRQFVAENYILEVDSGKQYFCKVVDKQQFIPGIIKTLPIVEEMHLKGIEKICYPIRNAQGHHLLIDDTLIVLFNYINAEQSFDYNLKALGKTIAEVHAITSDIKLQAPKEAFEFPNRELFDERFEGALASQSDDPIVSQFKKLLVNHEKKVRRNIEIFLGLCRVCQTITFTPVITHGDISTNVLVKSPEDLYIVDWDEMRLAPAERDIWMLDERSGFMEGYKSIRPDFIVNKDMCGFCILKYYFERMMHYFSEILNDFAGSAYRVECINKLDQGRLAGWILSKVEGGFKS